MTSHACRIAGAALLALALLPLSARANDSSPTMQRPTPFDDLRPSPNDSYTDTGPRDIRRLHAPGPLTAVNERVTRDLGNGCRYEATVRGTIRSRKRTRGEGFDPQLALRAQVVCADGVHASAPPATIRGRDIPRRHLEERLLERGRVLATDGDRTCTYTPSFSVTDRGVTTHAVWQACSTVTPPAIGGGPHPTRR